MRDYYAHVIKNGKKQTVKEHLEGTALLASKLAAAFDSAEQGKLVGLAHDIGKFSEPFQKRLLYEGPKVDHSSAGAFECAKINQMYAAFCIAGHHGGLPDMGTRDDDTEGTLFGKLNRAMSGRIPSYERWKEEIILPNATLPSLREANSLSDMFFVRMLFSCLVDADFLDTEHFMKEENSSYREKRESSLSELYVKLIKKIDENGWLNPRGLLNEKRSEILQQCMDIGIEKPGFFTLSVPTGGGKTISSLAFALKHAINNNMDRIIYVIPYTSIIEQTAQVFRKILGEENVLEHHSGVDYSSDEYASEYEIKMGLATENWDMPVVVTTAVQFFESLFAVKTSKCRKLHNMANSVIVFDEAQMLPLPYLRPCIYSIAQLVSNYNATAVLCTATQPMLNNIFKEFLREYSPKEICSEDIFLNSIFKRSTIKIAGSMDWAEVAEYMNNEHQVLCIVNSRAGARKLYQLLQGDGCYHLSTLMVPEDRKKKLQDIREKLVAGEECRVVSTSLIEAGVDVDFPRVLREEAGVDSIIQAAGRCNREGKKSSDDSIVTVFRSEDKSPELFKTNIGVGRMIMREYDDITSPEAISAYFNELFSIKGTESLDGKSIIKHSSDASFPFRSIANDFHLIDNDTETIYIPTGYGAELLERRKNGEISKKLIRELNQYSVNVYENHFKNLQAAGDIQSLDDGSWYLCNESLYDNDVGLSITADYGKAEFI